MKADVLPITTAEPLRIPSCVPQSVAGVAHGGSNKIIEAAAAFAAFTWWRVIFVRTNHGIEVSPETRAIWKTRLDEVLPLFVNDPRMHRVWRELQRRRRDGKYLHPALSFSPRGPSLDPDTTDAEERQGVAMASLLKTVLTSYATRPAIPLTKAKAERVRNRHLEMARRLRSDAPKSGERRREFMAAAEFYEASAEEAGAAIPLSFERNYGHLIDRWYTFAVAGACKELFGSPLYGITATIASVALGREVGVGAVRRWYTGHPYTRHPAGKARA